MTKNKREVLEQQFPEVVAEFEARLHEELIKSLESGRGANKISDNDPMWAVLHAFVSVAAQNQAYAGQLMTATLAQASADLAQMNNEAIKQLKALTAEAVQEINTAKAELKSEIKNYNDKTEKIVDALGKVAAAMTKHNKKLDEFSVVKRKRFLPF